MRHACIVSCGTSGGGSAHCVGAPQPCARRSSPASARGCALGECGGALCFSITATTISTISRKRCEGVAGTPSRSVWRRRGPHANFFHGEDVNLFSPDCSQFTYNLEEFFAHAKKRFGLLHFAGDGHMSFFPHYYASDEPPDIVEWRALGHKIAYTISGCNSGAAQSSVTPWSRTDGGSVCDKCPWQQEPSVCSDAKNLAWGQKVEQFCDVIFTEASPALDYQAGAKAVREPTTMCLDPSFWRPELPVPQRFRIPRNGRELLVYHAFGNMDVRTRTGRNI